MVLERGEWMMLGEGKGWCKRGIEGLVSPVPPAMRCACRNGWNNVSRISSDTPTPWSSIVTTNMLSDSTARLCDEPEDLVECWEIDATSTRISVLMWTYRSTSPLSLYLIALLTKHSTFSNNQCESEMIIVHKSVGSWCTTNLRPMGMMERRQREAWERIFVSSKVPFAGTKAMLLLLLQ